MSSKPQGWFVRQVRKCLQDEWDKEYLKLGSVNRWQCRENAWDEAKDTIGFGSIQRIIRERYNAAEQSVLKANQKAFRQAVKKSREEVDLQTTLPGMVRDEIRKNLDPIQEKYVKVPGADKDFSELIQIRDIDFAEIYQMALVRDDGIVEDLLSREDYDFMDRVRSSLSATPIQTLGQVFGLSA